MQSLTSTRLLYRKATLKDIPFIMQTEQENYPFVNCWDEQQHQEAIQHPNQIHIIMEQKTEPSRPIGFIMLRDIDNPHGSVEFFRFALTIKGQGFGREALQAVKNWCFSKPQTHRLWLDVVDFNHIAQQLYKSEGFVQEGILRECFKGNNRYDSLIIMSILRDEYKK